MLMRNVSVPAFHKGNNVIANGHWVLKRNVSSSINVFFSKERAPLAIVDVLIYPIRTNHAVERILTGAVSDVCVPFCLRSINTVGKSDVWSCSILFVSML